MTAGDVTDPWYVVAGGPSLVGFDWRRFDGRRVIAVNRAFEVLPNAEAVYFTDHRFWGWHKENILGHSGRKITGAARKHVEHREVENWKLTGTQGLDDVPGCLRHGNNSGYAAINVSYHLGARRIYLFGFDMRYSRDGRSHWHGEHPTLHRERVFEKMLLHFSSLAKDLKERGLQVWNANISSKLHAFPFCTVEEAINDEPPSPEWVRAVTYSNESNM